MEFGKFLKNRRIRLNLSQNDLAEKISYSPQVISKWEKGLSYPSVETVFPLCQALKLSLKDFFLFDPSVPTRTLKEEDSFNEQDFSALVRVLRTRNRLTQKELANQVGLNAQTIIKLESGKTSPDIHLLQKLAEVLNVDALYLYGYKEKIEKKPLGQKEMELRKARFFRLGFALSLLLILIAYAIWFSYTRGYQFWFNGSRY